MQSFNRVFFFLILLVLPLCATGNNPNSSISLRYIEIYSGLNVSGTQTRAEENSCSYNEYSISGTFYTDSALICEVWDDGAIKDSQIIYSTASQEQTLNMSLSFEGLFLSSNPGVGIYCHEQGATSNIFEYDPFYPDEVSGYCPSTVSTHSSSSLSPERSCTLGGGIYMQSVSDEYECIYPNNSKESCEVTGGQWIFSLGSYICSDMFSSSSISSSSSINPEVLETVKVEQSLYVASLEEFEYGSDEQKARLKIVEEILKKDEKVLAVERTESGNALWVSYRDGFDGLISTTPDDSKGSISIELVDTTKSTLRNSDIIGNNKVLSIMAQYYTWGENDDIPLITALLEDHGYDVSKKVYEDKNSGNIDDFKDWDQYGIILVSSHGEATKSKTAIHINAELNSSGILNYQDDLKAKRLVVWGNSYGITEGFIEKYNNTFPNTLVYMSICKGAYNNTLAETIIDKGAGSYLSYDNYVDVSFAKTYGVKLFEDLLRLEASLSTAYTSGTKEIDNDPAELKLFGSNELSIQLENTSIIDDSKSIIDTILEVVGDKSMSFNGHFVHYGVGSFDWIYILSTGSGVYKLNGLKSDGYIEWSENLIENFSDVVFSPDGKSVYFSSASSTLEVVKAIENKEFFINGHFVHYNPGAFDWIYITASGNGVYKLNGLKKDGKFNWSDNLAKEFHNILVDPKNKSVQFDLEDALVLPK